MRDLRRRHRIGAIRDEGWHRRYSGSFFGYFRNSALNTNYFFNDLHGLPKDFATVRNYGATVGGPIQIPHVSRRGQGVLLCRSRELQPPKQHHSDTSGVDAGCAAGRVHVHDTRVASVKSTCLQLALQNGQLGTVDPVIRESPRADSFRRRVHRRRDPEHGTEYQSYTYRFEGVDSFRSPRSDSM